MAVAVSIIGLAMWGLAGLDDEPAPASTVPGSSVGTADAAATFSYSCESLSCVFEGPALGDTAAVTRWHWLFGDGADSRVQSTVTHSYARPGIFRASLTLDFADGESVTVVKGVNPDGPTVTAQVSPIAPSVYPFGPHIGTAGGWADVDPKFTSAHISPYPETVLDELKAAREDDKPIILLLARSAGNYKNPDGTFNLDMWKTEIDTYSGVNFAPWVEDGTLLAHYLISEPLARSRWGGEVIPVEVLDEMARYSKQLWPSLATVVREQPTDLELHAGGFETPLPGWRWTFLDAGWARYSARMGPIEEFIEDEVASAKSQRLALLFGMNVLAGGDGSSETIGYNDGFVMSPEELRRYGTRLIDEPYGCANIMWHLSHDGIPYFELPEVDQVMGELAQRARSRAPIACVPGGVRNNT